MSVGRHWNHACIYRIHGAAWVRHAPTATVRQAARPSARRPDAGRVQRVRCVRDTETCGSHQSGTIPHWNHTRSSLIHCAVVVGAWRLDGPSTATRPRRMRTSANKTSPFMLKQYKPLSFDSYMMLIDAKPAQGDRLYHDRSQ